MTTKDPAAPGFKQKAKEEFKDYMAISFYLAFFLCALVTYTNMVLNKHGIDSVRYALAIINALVIAKVILIGELMKLGKRVEARPLYQTVVLKAAIFTLLVLAFHLVEEVVKRLIHGEPRGTVLENIHMDATVASSVIIFLTFMPLFAFRELRRVMGAEKLDEIFLGKANSPSLPPGK